MERTGCNVRLLCRRVRPLLAAEIVASEGDARVAVAKREVLDAHVDGSSGRPCDRRVGRAVAEQAAEQRRLAHLRVANEYELARARDGRAGLQVGEVGTDCRDAAVGDGEGRQLERVVPDVPARGASVERVRAVGTRAAWEVGGMRRRRRVRGERRAQLRQ